MKRSVPLIVLICELGVGCVSTVSGGFVPTSSVSSRRITNGNILGRKRTREGTVSHSENRAQEHYLLQSPSSNNHQQSATSGGWNKNANSFSSSDRVRPFPTMPSQHFLSLAQSQLELLASSLHVSSAERSTPTNEYEPNNNSANASGTKVKSMALYLPRENTNTGQLEFVPVVTWPPPGSQRVWIASDASSKQPPSIPRTLTRLPGFTHAKSLLPRYPFAAQQNDFTDPSEYNAIGSAVGVGPVEDLFCETIVTQPGDNHSDNDNVGEVLSVALYRGSQTLGVLLVWPHNNYPSSSYFWTALNRKQVSNAAYGLSIALSMDLEGTQSNSEYKSIQGLPSTNSQQYTNMPSIRQIYGDSVNFQSNNNNNNNIYGYISAQTYQDLVRAQLAQTEQLRRALSDNLHQVKNPLQALRTFGKLLQRKLALEELTLTSESRGTNDLSSLRVLADRMMVQTDRVIELLKPMEHIVDQLENSTVGVPPYWSLPGSTVDSSLQSSYRPFYLSPAEPRVGSVWDKPAPAYLQTKQQPVFVADLDTSNNPSLESSGSGSDQAVFFAPSNTYSTFLQTSVINDDGSAKPTPNLGNGRSSSGPASDQTLSKTEPLATPPSPTLGDVNVEMAFIPDVIEPILANAAAVAADKGVQFEIVPIADDDLPGVKICPKSLQEALSNVIENAIKYVVVGKPANTSHSVSLHNPNPRVRVSVVPNSNPCPKGVSIIVEDNGPGIPHLERDAVFQRGFRGSNIKDSLPGNGIGLDICKSMLSRFGGQLELLENGPEYLDGTVMRIMVFR